MFSLDQFYILSKAVSVPAVTSAPGTSQPAFKPPKAPPKPKMPKGSKPTAAGKAMPQHTISQWKTGPHIKLEDGWFPYDPKGKKYKADDGKWIKVK